MQFVLSCIGLLLIGRSSQLGRDGLFSHSSILSTPATSYDEDCAPRVGGWAVPLVESFQILQAFRTPDFLTLKDPSLTLSRPCLEGCIHSCLPGFQILLRQILSGVLFDFDYAGRASFLNPQFSQPLNDLCKCPRLVHSPELPCCFHPPIC